jgi:hypothetical protein
MRKVTVTSAFDRTVDLTSKALKRSMKRSGIETDPALLLYNKLTKDDLSDLANLYGEDDVMDYVKTMESKRLFRR